MTTETPVLDRRSYAESMARVQQAADSGDCDAGLEASAAARRDAAARGDTVQEAAALREQARFLTWSGDLEGAVAACEEGREVLRDTGTGQTRQACDLAVAQAFALTGLGLGEEAMELLVDTLSLAEQLGDRALLYWVHNRTGYAYDSFGEHETARRMLHQALAIADDPDTAGAVDDQSRWSIITNLVNNAMYLVPALRSQQRARDAEQVLLEALDHATQAVEQCRRSSRPYELCLSLGNLGAVHQLAGEHETSLATLHHALDLADKHDYYPLRMSALQHMPAALLDLGRAQDAVDVLADVVTMAIELGELPVQVEVLRQLADVHEARGAVREALASYRAFHDAEKQLRRGRALTRGRILAHQAHLEQARLEAADVRARHQELLTHQQALRERTRELERHAHTDALTGLANRRYADVALPSLHSQSRARGEQLWIAVMDLDHFKHVNDAYGHPTGDQVLVRVAELLQAVCRPQDLLARYGGEEFLLAMLDVDERTAHIICERLRARIDGDDWSQIRPSLRVTVSVGLHRSTEAAYADTVEHADRLLYRAKAEGRNRVVSSSGNTYLVAHVMPR